MIKLEIDKWCDNCDEFEPEVHKDNNSEYLYNSMTGNYIPRYDCTTVIECAHRCRCHSIMKYLVDKRNEEKSDG